MLPAMASWTCSICLLDAADFKVHRSLQKGCSKYGNVFVVSLAFRHDGSKLISASSDDTIIIWDAPTGNAEHTIKVTCGGDDNNAVSLAFRPQSSNFASACVHDTVKVWDSDTGGIVYDLAAS